MNAAAQRGGIPVIVAAGVTVVFGTELSSVVVVPTAVADVGSSVGSGTPCVVIIVLLASEC